MTKGTAECLWFGPGGEKNALADRNLWKMQLRMLLFSFTWTNRGVSQVPSDFKLSAEICADDDDDDTSRTIEKYVFK